MEGIHVEILGADGSLRSKSRLIVLSCENPEKCDLYTKKKLCIGKVCKFAELRTETGCTKRSKKYHDQLKSWRENYKDLIGNIKIFVPQGICKIQNFFYLQAIRSIGTTSHLIKNAWLDEGRLDGELLNRICNYRPVNLIREPIPSYQKKTIPRLVQDLYNYHNELYCKLSPKNQQKKELHTNVGRFAFLQTCLPSTFFTGNKKWVWNGRTLIAEDFPVSPLGLPLNSAKKIAIEPNENTWIKIDNDSQVDFNTVFLD